MDPETNANKGYAFINFCELTTACRFKHCFEGQTMNRFNSNKQISVVRATLQGFDANYAHYSSARVNRGDPSARPLFLRESNRASAHCVESLGRRRKCSAIDSAARKTESLGGHTRFTPTDSAALQAGPAVPCSQHVQTTAETGQTVLAVRFCVYCGTSVSPDWRFCQSCGKRIQGNSPELKHS